MLHMVNTWRNTNEVWESVYSRSVVQRGPFAPVKFNNDHRATFWVWELAPVWHERGAWVRFIQSARDEAAKHVYVNDVFSGEV